jgi:hypothetical protein
VEQRRHLLQWRHRTLRVIRSHCHGRPSVAAA